MNNFDLAKQYFLDGLAFLEAEKFADAEYQFNRSLKILPNRVSTLTNLSVAQLKLKKYTDARASLERAILIENDNCEAYLNLGIIEKELGNLRSADAYFDKALSFNPNYPEAWLNKGNILHTLKKYDDAITHYDKALVLKPHYSEAWANKGLTLHEVIDDKEAIIHFDKAISLNPDNQEAYWNKALSLLHQGNYELGWELFEWRWKLGSQRDSFRHYDQPLWLGQESLTGKTILLWAEQGLGDTIQFCRYVQKISDLGAKVILEVQKQLVNALKNMPAVSQVIELGQAVDFFDFHAPLMSLPLAFKTRLETIPSNIPYIFPDVHKSTYWNKKLNTEKKIKVGLVWSSGHRADQPVLWSITDKKNIPLSALENLKLPNVQFYSLQKGAEAEEQLTLLEGAGWNGPQIQNDSKQLNDFSDTAALISNLDLVISVDTSVAHMAGALGKPVWVLSQFVVDWRWMPGQKEAWYPNARVFQQPSPGNWEAVVTELVIALKEFCQS